MDVRDCVREDGSPVSKTFEIVVQILIIVSMITFALETLPQLSEAHRSLLHYAEIVIVAFFTAEYVLRLWAAKQKLRHVFSFMALVDLIAILPFYLALGLDMRGVDMRSLRVLRLFRIFRALKILRYTKALERFGRAFYEIRTELLIYLMATGFLLYLASVGIYYFEHEAQPESFGSVFHCLWWAVVTFTTVGYGDVYPITLGGRLFTFMVLMIGLGVIAVPSGLIASALTRAIQREDKENARE